MSNYNLEALHAACIEWAKNPVWKDWQVDSKLNIEYIGKQALSITDANRDVAIGIYLDFEEESPSNIFLFAQLAGIDIEQFKHKAWTYKTAVLDAIEKAGGEYHFGNDILARKKGDFTLLNYGVIEYITVHVDAIDQQSQWAVIYILLRLDLTGNYPIEQQESK